MRIFGLKTCDTCRKARKALPEAEFVDVRAAPLSKEDLARFWQVLGEGLLNKRSTTWKGLDEGARAGDPVDLMLAHPALMKRPVIEDGDALYLGWTGEVQAKLLGK